MTTRIIFLLFLMAAAALPAMAADFTAFKQSLRREAAAAGVRAEFFDRVMADVRPLPRVIELDRKQPEKKLTYTQYRDKVISADRIRKGRTHVDNNRTLLSAIEKQYRVPREVVVALWGVETSYGQNTGGFSILSALTTLAFDGRRSGYFKGELINALKILQAGHISPQEFRGSWAGAMGQCQFMPSSFLQFAVDHDGDGHKDIWTTRADVFASAANYLSRSGWQWGVPVAVPVRLTRPVSQSLTGLDIRKTVAQWQQMGVETANAQPGMNASLLMPDGPQGRAYLAFDNFRVLMKWNRSVYFGLSVSEIASQVK